MKVFKVMAIKGREYPHRQVSFVPWDWISRFERQAQRNHSQSLETLDSRGGLSPLEMYAVVEGMSFREACRVQTEAGAIQWLLMLFSAAPMQDQNGRRLI